MLTDTIVQKVVEFTTPANCLVCQAEPFVLCDSCARATLSTVASGCVVCGLAQRQGLTCRGCRNATPLQGLRAVTSYDDLGKMLIRAFKFDGNQEAGRVCAKLMAAMADAGNYDVVVAATTTAARRRQRGYDQSVLLAQWVAHRLQLPHVAALVRIKNVHQVGASREMRLIQSAGLYMAINGAKLRGQRILLIDDVVTTGATAAAAAAALLEVGATSVECLAFARDILTSEKLIFG